MKPEELVIKFIKERLEGEIDRLQTFELGKLRGDKTFGCPGRKDDSDDTELMRELVIEGAPGYGCQFPKDENRETEVSGFRFFFCLVLK